MSDCIGDWFMLGNEFLPVSSFRENLLNPDKLVYEVLRVEEGIPLFIDDYLDRLEKTINISRLPVNFDRQYVKQSFYRLIKTNNDLNGPIKLMLSPENIVIHYMKPYLPEPHEYQTGVKTILVHEERVNPNAKIWNPAFREKIIKALQTHNAYEAILVNREGEITEGGRSNIFFAKGGELFTAPANMVLPGITRMKVMEVCLSAKIRVNQIKIPYQSITQYEAAFLTGTSRKVVPVKQIDDFVFPAGNPLIKIISEKFEELISAYIQQEKSRNVSFTL